MQIDVYSVCVRVDAGDDDGGDGGDSVFLLHGAAMHLQTPHRLLPPEDQGSGR